MQSPFREMPEKVQEWSVFSTERRLLHFYFTYILFLFKWMIEM